MVISYTPVANYRQCTVEARLKYLHRQRDDEHAGCDAKLDQAPARNVRTLPTMPREKVQAAPTARPKVPMRRRGADCLVLATKVL
jgi:hypothetical protein